ncbi:MAG: glycoside hydrolase family 97 catalytic domain-containing protein [Petrimonas sp.]|nr:glycoside hydrolase family 97 catalytic domain-containing protein [Petrimonas sp.]
MKKTTLSVCFMLISLVMFAQKTTSPDGKLVLTLMLDDGVPSYTVDYDGKVFLEKSPLGLEASLGDFTKNLKFVDSEIKNINEKYTLPHAKVREVNYAANELTATFVNDKSDSLDIIFSVSNNDVAQAYRLRSNKTRFCTVFAEKTGFNFPEETTKFATPQIQGGEGWMQSKPSYEEEYVFEQPMDVPSRFGLGYTFPALFHLKNGWVLLSETGVSSRYCGTRLGDGSSDGIFTIAFPDKSENAGAGDVSPTAPLPLMTSWKTITIGETLKPIVETTSAYNTVKPLYEPSINYKPGRSTWSWILWQDASCNYEDQKTFINLAADMGYEYILIDALWDVQIGYENMPPLIRYAQSKGVDVLLWYNSNGEWNNAPQGPRNRMDTSPAREKEMAWMQSLGVKGIKVNFFGGDKQVVMKLYEDILTDANKYGLFVNFHGTTLPRGWERMYPNHFTSEATLASENLVFSQAFADKEAQRSTILPFTRNAVSATDFGPVFFNKRFAKTDEHGNIRCTTDAFQLATSVLYQSPLQHFGIVPENLSQQPAYVINFMKNVPVIWNESVFVDGYPGKYVVIARRNGNKWYITGTNAETDTKKITLSLPWLSGSNVSVIYDKKDRTAGFRQAKIDKKGNIGIEIEPLGGFVIY